MKVSRVVFTILFLLSAAAFQLPAQQADADRKLLAEIREQAEKGDAKSQDELGGVFSVGRLGQAKNYLEAVKWYRKAAEQGNSDSQCALGLLYYEGTGVPQDLREGFVWLRKSAEQGHAFAQYAVGLYYLRSEGVEKFGVERDYLEAEKWFRLASNAEWSVPAAKFQLGSMYLNGWGVPKSFVEGAIWIRKAAEDGSVDAQNSLGWLYQEGKGVTKDYIEAYKWFNLAAAQGNELSTHSREYVAQIMTPAQIAEAQRLARVFKPRKPPRPGTMFSGRDIFDSNPTSSGTGFFISADGFLVTNEHVVSDAAQVRLVTSAGFVSAKVVKVDAANDLALLKAEGKFTPLTVASSRPVKLGGTVATVGFPNIGLQGFAPKLAKGEIASLSGARDDPRYFQISVPVQPGNSGGALVDERGDVVGVVSAKLNTATALAATGALPENVNYAIKSSFLLSFLESVPEVSAKLKEPNTKEQKFEDVVKAAEQAAVLVLVY